MYNDGAHLNSNFSAACCVTILESISEPLLPRMEAIDTILSSICSQSGHCVERSEVEVALVLSVVGILLSIASARQIQQRRLFGTSSDFYKLKDDMFDTALIYIFGAIVLVLVAFTIRSEYDFVQLDVLLFNIVLGVSAFAIRDNLAAGILFTTLSYSSWYGLFRLFFFAPVTEDLYILLQPRWLTSLIAFTAPALIANLKYPALIQSSLSLVTYGTVLFGLLIACNASFVLVDLAIVYSEWYPEYASVMSSRASQQMYGPGVSLLHRVGYYAAMVVLQFICVRIPHFMLNEDGLQEQLREQTEAALEDTAQRRRPGTSSGSARAPKVQGSHDAADVLKQVRKAAAAAGTASSAAAGGADSGAAAGSKQDSEERADLPADCVEITPEEAIRLQERALQSRTSGVAKSGASSGSTSGVADAATPSASGLKNRKASAAAPK
jgi:hypothetical protein